MATATMRTCLPLQVLVFAVMATGVCAVGVSQAIIGNEEARHKELFHLVNAGDYAKAASYFTVEGLLMDPKYPDARGRDAIEETLKATMHDYRPLTSLGIVYSEMLDDNTVLIYHHTGSFDESGKPRQLQRDVSIWKRVGGEWFDDSLIYNDLPLSDM